MNLFYIITLIFVILFYNINESNPIENLTVLSNEAVQNIASIYNNENIMRLNDIDANNIVSKKLKTTDIISNTDTSESVYTKMITVSGNIKSDSIFGKSIQAGNIDSLGDISIKNYSLAPKPFYIAQYTNAWDTNGKTITNVLSPVESGSTIKIVSSTLDASNLGQLWIGEQFGGVYRYYNLKYKKYLTSGIGTGYGLNVYTPITLEDAFTMGSGKSTLRQSWTFEPYFNSGFSNQAYAIVNAQSNQLIFAGPTEAVLSNTNGIQTQWFIVPQ